MKPGRLYLAFFATVVGTAVALSAETNSATIFLSIVGCLQGVALGIATIAALAQAPCSGCQELHEQWQRTDRRLREADKALLTLRSLQ